MSARRCRRQGSVVRRRRQAPAHGDIFHRKEQRAQKWINQLDPFIGCFFAAPGNRDKTADRKRHAEREPTQPAARQDEDCQDGGKHRRRIDDRRGNRAAHGANAAKTQHPGNPGDNRPTATKIKFSPTNRRVSEFEIKCAPSRNAHSRQWLSKRPTAPRPLIAPLRQQTGNRETQ